MVIDASMTAGCSTITSPPPLEFTVAGTGTAFGIFSSRTVSEVSVSRSIPPQFGRLTFAVIGASRWTSVAPSGGVTFATVGVPGGLLHSPSAPAPAPAPPSIRASPIARPERPAASLRARRGVRGVLPLSRVTVVLLLLVEGTPTARSPGGRVMRC